MWLLRWTQRIDCEVSISILNNKNTYFKPISPFTIENLTLTYSQRNERFPIFFLHIIQKCVCLWLNKRTFSAARANHTQFHLPKICQRSVLMKYKLLPWDISIFTGNLNLINFNVNKPRYRVTLYEIWMAINISRWLK